VNLRLILESAKIIVANHIADYFFQGLVEDQI